MLKNSDFRQKFEDLKSNLISDKNPPFIGANIYQI